MASEEPRIAARKPVPVQLEAGVTYRWCSCGHSKKQPWYDEASCTPYCDSDKRELKAEESGEVYMCVCKHTKNATGRCDGTHRKLPAAGAAGAAAPPAAAQPHIAARKPVPVQLEAGQTYRWCSCGHSKKQPWYDEASCTPYCDSDKRELKAEESGEVYMCVCKHTKNATGRCDGTHRKLPAAPSSGGGGGGALDIEDLGAAVARRTAPDDDEPTAEEPTLGMVKLLARDGLKMGHHGPMVSMGVPRPTLPQWDDIQFVTAQLATRPLLEDVPVDTRLVIGPRAKKPLVLDIPLFVSDMSFGALSREAKVALARGAELAGTGICSGEGGMLPAEREANSRYFYELASAEFGWDFEHVKHVQAFHFKGGQGAKTGTGGHLPGRKVTAEIAEVRKLAAGQDAVSPPTFGDHLRTAEDFRKFADRVREVSGGIPVGFKLSAQHIENDIDFALAASADYIILDGRGGGTGAAPAIFRDHISVPTIPALARARLHLDRRGAKDVTLIATGGLRLPADFAKAMALGADGVAVANSALQSIGCVAARMCGTNQCPSGVATQDKGLRALLDVDKGARQLNNFFRASASLMQVLARACGHDSLAKFSINDLTTWKKEMAELSGVRFGGVGLRRD